MPVSFFSAQLIASGERDAPSHVPRALRSTDPARVCAVLLGQEPYSKPGWVTPPIPS